MAQTSSVRGFASVDEDLVLTVIGLKVWFKTRSGIMSRLTREPPRYLRAVDGVSFQVKKGEILCLAGESGSGKSTTGLAILRLVQPTEGSVLFKKEDITSLKKKELKSIRRYVQMVFQDPYESLNPRMTVYDTLAEPLQIHHMLKSKEETRKKVAQLLEDVELVPPENLMYKFPHELSGGQRQRVAIASALALDLEFLVADEPVSMLDLSIRAEVLNLLLSLRERLGLAILFITHDLSTAYHVADRIAIMYLGKIMEIGSSEEVINHPLHPYTKALIAAIPGTTSKEMLWKKISKAEIPSAINIPTGCRFRDRCPYADANCAAEEPELKEWRSAHLAACIYADKL
jgi:peptide/nickel transport system ATP-binding protein